ncbi:hypothetical protein DV735_g2356, partial [Chaetothyriales sp. CBS 134920]
MGAHETTPGTDVYGPGTFIDKQVLPVPKDTRRVFELLASKTPTFTQDKAAWDTVQFEGGDKPIVPGPIKSTVLAAALHGMTGLVGNELLELRDGKKVTDSSVKINTDHAAIWLGSIFTAHVKGRDVADWIRAGKLTSLFEHDFEHGFFGTGIASRTTALYRTKYPKIWYQLHGSLDANKTLESMGIAANMKLDGNQQYYDYLQNNISRWVPDELELHDVRNGLCGSICYTPEGWSKTEMGRALSKHPLVNVTEEKYAKSTPPIPLPTGLSDRRPLAGIKVLELSLIIAAPAIGSTLASYGADVIRVHDAKMPDINVSSPESHVFLVVWSALSLTRFLSSLRTIKTQVLQLVLNAGKRTVELDLSKATDLARLHELIEGADIFIQGFRRSQLGVIGLGLHDLLEVAAKRNKGIIYVEANCYGPDGPYAERPGWEQIGDAASGISYVMGRSQGGDECVLPSVPGCDMTTGLVGALAAMIAVRERAVRGGSYNITSALVAAGTAALDPDVGLYPLDVVRATAERFSFPPTTPDQYAWELLASVIDGWKRDVVGVELDENKSKLLTTFEDGHWGKQSILKPVAKLDSEEASPSWTSCPVPHGYNGWGTTWI